MTRLCNLSCVNLSWCFFIKREIGNDAKSEKKNLKWFLSRSNLPVLTWFDRPSSRKGLVLIVFPAELDVWKKAELCGLAAISLFYVQPHCWVLGQILLGVGYWSGVWCILFVSYLTRLKLSHMRETRSLSMWMEAPERLHASVILRPQLPQREWKTDRLQQHLVMDLV